MCYVPLMALAPPSLPPPSQDYPARAPCLQTIFPRVHISLLLLPPLRPFFVYLPSPPVAPVVTCRPPVSDWRPVPCCPWCPVQCPVVWGFAPPPPDLCGWRYLARVWVEGRRRLCPPDGLEVFNASRHTYRNNRSIFRALDSPHYGR